MKGHSYAGTNCNDAWLTPPVPSYAGRLYSFLLVQESRETDRSYPALGKPKIAPSFQITAALPEGGSNTPFFKLDPKINS